MAPMWGLEDDIYKVTVSGAANHHNVWCVNGADITIYTTKNANNRVMKSAYDTSQRS